MAWYSLFVITGQEENVASWLQFFFESAVKTLIPKRKLLERHNGKNQPVCRNMFPGYVFLSIDMDLNAYYQIKQISGVIRILNYDREKYDQHFQEEIQFILRLLGDGDVVDFSFVYLENNRVKVKSGPLQGLEGRIKSLDRRKQRVKILVSLLGIEKKIDLGIEIIHEINSLDEGTYENCRLCQTSCSK